MKMSCPHGHTYTDDNTYKNQGSYRCKVCALESQRRRRSNRKLYLREWRKRHYESHIKPKVHAIREYILARRDKCVECGETHPACLDFHHVDPAKKSFQITATRLANRSWESIVAEVDKCVVLCSNCHRKHHYQEKRQTS